MRQASLTALAVLTFLNTNPAASQTSLSDVGSLKDDWGQLSPRIHCFGINLAMEDAGDHRKKASPDKLARIDLRGAEGRIRYFHETRYNPGWENHEYSGKVASAMAVVGEVAAVDPVNRALVARLLASALALRLPVPLKQDGLEGEIIKACGAEYLAAAYGIGEMKGPERYEALVRQWRSFFPSGNPTYYPRPLVSLNYLLARERLDQGDASGAFRLATDSVMTWGKANINHARGWVASFHALGIGTPRDMTKAIAIRDESNWVPDMIEAAVLRANAGQRQQAIQQLQTVLNKEWSGSAYHKRARLLYAQLSGAQWQPRRQPGFMEAMLAIPVAMIGFCYSNPGSCGSGANSNTSGSTDDLRNEWRQRRNDCARNLVETVNFGYSFSAC